MATSKPSELEPVECACGEAMELAHSGATESIPLVGETVEYRLYTCRECGSGRRYERRDEGWTRAVE